MKLNIKNINVNKNMEQLNVGGSYLKILSELKPEQYVKEPVPGTFETSQPFVAPPLNTDIRFSSILPKKHYTESQYLTVATIPLPEKWDWRNSYEIDDEIITSKKKNITKVPNQGLCGSCWAVAVAGVVGDVFVTSGISKTNPDISITYSLSCYPQHKCGGGNPAELLKDIEQSGISTNKCVSYNWCNEDLVCNGQGDKHFDPSSETNRINNLIPECGCYNGPEHALYYIKNPSLVVMENDNHDISTIIKSHIFNVGPVIGGYHVLRNFMSGNFTATGGVYMESFNYDTNQWYNNGESAQWAGSHAICVIGWGVSNPINIPMPDGRTHEVNVPYWYCRNSWGDKWGIDNGYFRIAMYPYNKKSQFERLVVIQPENMLSGGFVICSPNKVETTDKLKKLIKEKISVENFDNKIFEVDENLYNWVIIILLILLIEIIIYFMIYSRK